MTIWASFTGLRSRQRSHSLPSKNPPSVAVSPSLFGDPAVGQTLTCERGVWIGGQPITYFYQWYANGVAIPDATYNNFVLTSNQTNAQVFCRVTAANTDGSASSDSNIVTPILLTFPPENVTIPTISGSPILGATLTGNPGTWTNTPSFAYQWLRDDVPILDTTASTYVITPLDIGTKLSLRVTASNVWGAALATSSKTATIFDDAITNPVPPTITGTAYVGFTLTANPGTWTNSTSLTYQWKANGADIPGATGTTYVLSDADLTKFISVAVTARSPAGGTLTVSSSATTQISANAGSLFPTGDMPTGELVNGVAIGSAGTGIYAGFTLTYGDDFDVKPEPWSAANLSGKYMPCDARYQYVNNTPSIVMDKNYRGALSQSPTPLGLDPNDYTTVPGAVTLWANPIPDALRPLMPKLWRTGREYPYLYHGQIRTKPYFQISGHRNFIVEGVFDFDRGTLKRGYWPAFWMCSQAWPEGQEIDIIEGSRSGTVNNTLGQYYHGSTTDGGQDVSLGLGSMTDPGRPVWFCLVRKGDTLEFHTDHTTQGVLGLRRTYKNAARVNRLRFAHEVKVDMNVGLGGWSDGNTFTPNDYPGFMRCHWLRIWTPSTGGLNSYPRYFINETTPGGSWNFDLPAEDLFWNGPVPETYQWYMASWEYDAPGYATRVKDLNALAPNYYKADVPGGMTYDPVARTIRGTVPTDRGGAIALAFSGTYNSGKPAARTLIVWNVAPAVQSSLFANQTPARNAVVNLPIRYTDFHSGNLGAHTYQVNRLTGGSWLTISGNGTTDVTLTGTTPNAASSTVLEIRCTNSIGQTTTVTRTITVA